MKAASTKSHTSGPGYQNNKHLTDRLYSWLNAPVHASSLGLFRFAYGLIMVAQIMKWWSIFEEFKGSIYMVPYAGLGFFKPVHPDLGNLVLRICLVASLMLALGLFTRVMGPITFITFVYLFHLCESLHNNHYILMCHVNFVGSFLHWGRWCSLDNLLFGKRIKGKSPYVPYWNLLLMQLLFTIPYFYGSIAKMNSDWLFRAQPVTSWFSKHKEWIFHQWWFPWAICWGGMLYDGSISFLLFWRKTRYILGFPGAIFFNMSNKYIFNIGVFPYAMVCSLVLFVDPHTPAAVWNALMGLAPPIVPRLNMSAKDDESLKDKDDKNVNSMSHIFANTGALPLYCYTQRDNGTTSCHTVLLYFTINLSSFKVKTSQESKWNKYFVLVFVGSFVVFHALFPLRHFVLYESNPSWTEEGHIGAWHMKLRSKHGFIYLKAEGKDGTIVNLIPRADPYVTRGQLAKIETRPHAMLLYIARLNLVFEEANQPLESLMVESCFSLNTNAPRRLFIPSANMLKYIGKYERIGVTAIGKFLYTFDNAPYCDKTANPLLKPGGKNIAQEAYFELYKNANFSSNQPSGAYRRWWRVVTHQSQNGLLEYGYMWKKWSY